MDALGLPLRSHPTPGRHVDYPQAKARQIGYFVNRPKRFRRIALRRDKTLPAFMSFVHLACAMIWLSQMQIRTWPVS